MPEIKETAAAVTETMSFVQEFLQKKYAWGIVFFVLLIAGLITAIVFYNRGKEDGKEYATSEVSSLKASIRNDSMQIKRMRADYNYLQVQLDSCNKNSNTSNLEELVNRKLEEAERLKKILERKITNDEKINNNLKSILP